MPKNNTIRGRVIKEGVGPVAEAVVRLFDADPSIDDELGSATTGEYGAFAVEYDGGDAGGPAEGDPERYLAVSRGGERIHTEVVPDDADEVEVLVPSNDDETPVGDPEMPGHGGVEHRGMANVPRDTSHRGQGRFGRMLPYLRPARHDVAFLADVGLPGGPMDEGDESAGHADTVPAGFMFLGQFVDHDVTLDTTSSLDRQADPDALTNFRTPRLDLDNVYGAGPEASPFLYRSGDSAKLLLGRNDEGEPNDLPRNREGTALVGDPRNDENLILSQLHHVYLKFHNRVVDHLRDRGVTEDVFERAQELVRWHHQWIVLEEFLPTVCDDDLVADVRENRRYFDVEVGDRPYIPLEFAGAVYRYGHSQNRLSYRINDEFGSAPLFDRNDPEGSLGAGFRPVPGEKVVDWRNLFDLDGDPQPASEIDTKVSPDLLDLPFVPKSQPPERRSLASRNLVRGRRLGLPSGQAVARALDLPVLESEDVGWDEALAAHGRPPDGETPLWYYVLGEAEVETGGEKLGPVGGRLVAEVLVGLIETDPTSFEVVQPGWTPTLPAPHAGDDDFGMADLVSFALDLH